MIRIASPHPLALAIAVLVGALVLGCSSWAMGSMARPKDYKARLDALDVAMAELEHGAPGQRISGFGAQTLCRGALLPAAAALRSELVKQAGGAGMVLKAIDAAPGATSGRLAAIDISFTAEGPYEGAVKLISRLQTNRPEVFVDTATLTSDQNASRLKIKGRAFCWNSARP